MPNIRLGFALSKRWRHVKRCDSQATLT